MQIPYAQLLRAISQASDLAEAKELGHGQRVATYALAAADALGVLSRHDVSDLVVASLLHDIGMSSVAFHVAERCGSKDRSYLRRYPDPRDGRFGEPNLMPDVDPALSRHAELGARLCRQLGYSNASAELIALHHAHADGSGYPTFSANELPLAAQVLTLADLLDTATGDADTAEARRDLGVAALKTVRGRAIRADIVDSVAPAFAEVQIWEKALFLDNVEDEIARALRLENDTATFEEVELHIRILAQIIDAQSPYTSGHSFEVARLATRMGGRLGLDPTELNALHLASLMHGAGRLAISSATLEKRGGLTEHEFELLREYPNLTREALHPMRSLRPVVESASTHREKLDGSGYPDQLVGDEIPLFGRVIAVADTYIALVSERPYRPAHSHSRALAILQTESARLFDGLMTDALEAIYREGL